MRAIASRRDKVERHSIAPRYIGVTAFAECARTDVATFSRWVIHGPIWIPNPAVSLGAQHRSGWTKATAREWYQGMPRYLCPATIEYLSTTQMCERLRMTPETLWACIEDGTVDEPAMWLDGSTPGWLPPSKPPKTTGP